MVLLVAAGLAIAGCGADEPVEPEERPSVTFASPVASGQVEEGSPCEAAVQEAARAGIDPETQDPLWPAFEACESIEEFSAAVEDHPGVIPDDVDPQTYAEEQCGAATEVEGSAVCESL